MDGGISAGRVIWKYRIPEYDGRGMITSRPVIDMPDGARILTLQLQDDEPTLWAVVDPERVAAPRSFVIVGTGHPVPEDVGDYVGSWQWPGLVWHLFEAAR